MGAGQPLNPTPAGLKLLGTANLAALQDLLCDGDYALQAPALTVPFRELFSVEALEMVNAEMEARS